MLEGAHTVTVWSKWVVTSGGVQVGSESSHSRNEFAGCSGVGLQSAPRFSVVVGVDVI